MPEAHAARRDRLRAVLADRGADAALVTRLVNVRYLTGFTGSHAALLVPAGGCDILATDGRYKTQAAAQAPDVERLIDRSVASALAARAAADGVRRLAVEEHDVTLELQDALVAAAAGVSLGRLRRAVEELRAVKDEDELALLGEACAISDRALAALLPTVAPGRTERELALDLERRMVDEGAEAVGFETIVATGPHSAIPHHGPTDRPIARGDLLKIDFGARFGGYHADCTRTYVVGTEPAPWQREIYDVVRAAQRAGRRALAPGADVQDVDGAARRVVVDAGYGAAFPHGLGHGVGLEIHEAPLIGYAATGRLSDRTPVTVEPGIYLEGRGGVRIEDTLVVRDPDPRDPDLRGPDSGGVTAQLLTRTSKDLTVLG